MVQVDRRYEIIRPRVVDELIDDEVVVINLETGVYYGLRQVAAAIWTGVAAGASIAEITAAIQENVDDVPEHAASTIGAFVGELVADGLARTSDAATASPWSINGLSSPFVPPVLEKFSDLEDLLMLDPVHDVDAEGWPHIAGA